MTTSKEPPADEIITHVSLEQARQLQQIASSRGVEVEDIISEALDAFLNRVELLPKK